MGRRPPRSTQSRSSAASDVYKRQTPDRARPLSTRLRLIGWQALLRRPPEPARGTFATRQSGAPALSCAVVPTHHRTTAPPHHFRGGQKPPRMTIARLAGTPRRRLTAVSVLAQY